MKRRHFLVAASGAALAAALDVSGRRLSAEAQPPARPLHVHLWCGDSRMTWDDEPAAISLRMAAADQKFVYPKRPESFLIGFKRLVDYCARIGVHSITIWGFLRAAHGGVKAAAELCEYAADRGVGILPGVGLCSYGGYFYDGDHRFNLDTYLREHPERASSAREERGGRVVTPVLDPSLAANQAWWRDGLEWMLETFKIAGINYEMGDFVINSSPEAAAARAALGFEADGNILDIVVATRDLMDYAYRAKPDGVFINCTYRGCQDISGFPKMPYVDAVHPDTVWEYTLAGMVRRPGFPGEFAGMPEHRKYGYLHWFNPSTNTTDTDYVAEIARVFPGLVQLEFDFAGTYGEVSAIGNLLADRNYQAQAAWAKDPALTLDAFNAGFQPA
jgi:hypothetical protein